MKRKREKHPGLVVHGVDNDLLHGAPVRFLPVVDGKKPKIVPLLTLILSFTTFFYHALKPGKIFFYLDHGFQNIPFRYFGFKSFCEGIMPLWCPFSAGGFPFFAEGQSGLAYPLNWLFYWLLPFSSAYNISVIFHLFIFSAGSYCLLRKLGYSSTASLSGTLTLTFSGYLIRKLMFINYIQGFAWIPWMLFFIPNTNRNSKLKPLAMVSLCTGFLCLAGHPQAVLIGLSLALLYFFSIPSTAIPTPAKRNKALLAGVGLAMLLGLCIGAWQLLPTVELTTETTRYESQMLQLSGQMSLPPAYLPVVFLNHPFGSASTGTFDIGRWPAYEWELSIFIGISALFLAILAGFRAPRARFFWCCVAVGLILSLGRYTPVQEIIGRMPVLNSFRAPVRWSILFIWGFAGLVAHGVDRLRRVITEHKPMLPTVFLSFGLLSVILSVLLFLSLGSGIKSIQPDFMDAFSGAFVFLVCVGLVVVAAIRLNTTRVLLLIPLIIFAELYWANHDYVATCDQQIILGEPAGLEFMEDEGRILSLVQEKMPGITKDWHSGWSNPDQGDYWCLKDTYPMYCGMILQRDVLTFNEWSPLHYASYQKWARNLGILRGKTISNFNVRQIVTPKANQLFRGQSVFTGEEWDIQNLTLFCDSQEQSQGEKAVGRKIVSVGSETGFPGNDEILIEDRFSDCLDPKTQSVYQDKMLTPDVNTRCFESSEVDPTLVLLRAVYADGWKGNVGNRDNGTECQTIRYDTLFQGVLVPPGEHQIELKYEPFSYKLGLFLTLISLLTGISMLIVTPWLTGTRRTEIVIEYEDVSRSGFFYAVLTTGCLIMIGGWILYSELWYETLINWVI